MAQGKITKRAVEAIPVGDRDSYLWDTELKGFIVKVTPQGRRVYLVRYRVGQRTRRVTIGPHGSPWTADLARHEAKRLLGVVATGGDPAEEKTKARQESTVADLCDLYLEEGIATKKASTIATDRGRIARHIKPLLGQRKLSDVTRADVERFMSDVAAGKTAVEERTGFRGVARVTGGKGTAARTVGLLGSIFSFAERRGLVPSNPTRGVKRFKDKKCQRFLSPAEMAKLGDVLAKAEKDGTNVFGVAAIRLLALTGCRKGEILSLRWDYVDWDRNLLILPDSKTGAKVVRLGAPAKQVLSALPRFDDNPWVLPSTKVQGDHYKGLQKLWQDLRARAGLADVRLHDMRHSFASVAAGRGDSLLMIAALLGHKHTATTERYAHLLDDPQQAAADGIAKEIAERMGLGPENRVPAEVVRMPPPKPSR